MSAWFIDSELSTYLTDSEWNKKMCKQTFSKAHNHPIGLGNGRCKELLSYVLMQAVH